MDRILQRQTRLIRTMQEQFRFQKERFNRVQKSYAFRYPFRLYEQKLEQVDRLTEMLVRGSARLTSIKKNEHEVLEKRLHRNHPKQALKEAKSRYERSQKDMDKAIIQILRRKQTDFNRMMSTLRALSPLSIMERGYSLAYSENNRLLKSVAGVKVTDQVLIQLTDGSLYCRVEKIKESENRDE